MIVGDARAQPCSPSPAVAWCRALPPSVREAAGRPLWAMRRWRTAALVAPVQASATPTPRQWTCSRARARGAR